MHSSLPTTDSKFRARKTTGLADRINQAVRAVKTSLGLEDEGDDEATAGLGEKSSSSSRSNKLTANNKPWWLAGVVVTFIWVLWMLSHSRMPYVPIKNQATSFTRVSSPYIHPDMARLAEYKLMQSVSLSNGKKVNSAKHSYVYTGDGPEVVMVVGLDSEKGYPADYLKRVVEERLTYTKKKGYGLFARYLKDFETPVILGENDETRFQRAEFAKIALLREAMFTFPKAKWFWWLEQDAIIVNKNHDVSALINPASLDKIMLRDKPVVPSGSIVHSYKRVPSDQMRFILTQNDRGLSISSFLLSNEGYYGQFVLEYWLDPAHRNYHTFLDASGNQYAAVESSLTHLIQWHPAILSRLTFVPHTYLGSRMVDGEILKGQADEPHNILLLRATNEKGFPGVDKLNQLWLNNMHGEGPGPGSGKPPGPLKAPGDESQLDVKPKEPKAPYNGAKGKVPAPKPQEEQVV